MSEEGNTQLIEKPKTDQEVRFDASSTDITKRASEIVVDDAKSAEEAGEMLQTIKSLKKEVETYWKPITDATNKAHKAATGKRGEMLGPIEAVSSTLRGKVGVYQQKVEAEERKRQQEADRLQREQEAAAKKAEEDRRLEEALHLKKMGKEEEAEAVISAPVEVPVPIPTPIVAPAPKVAKGIGTMKRWTAELVDIKVLMQAIIDGKAPPTLVEFNQKVASQMAVALKDSMKYPGVNFIQKISTTVR